MKNLLYAWCLALVILSYAEIARAQTPIAPNVIAKSSTQVVVPFAVANGDNLVDDLTILVKNSPAPASLEILLSHDNYPTVHADKFVMSKGQYTIDELLTRLQSVMPGLRWATEDEILRLRLDLNKNINDPIDQTLTEGDSSTRTLTGWIDWLNSQNPNLGFTYNGNSLSDYVPNTILEQKITLRLEKGITTRAVLDQIAQQSDTHWIATIRDYTISGLSILRDGKRVQLVPRHKQYVDRVELAFVPVKR